MVKAGSMVLSITLSVTLAATAGSLARGAESGSDDADRFAGTWYLSDPAGESPLPGAISTILVLSIRNGSLKGSYRLSGIGTPLTDVQLKNGVLSFQLTLFSLPEGHSAVVSADGKQLKMWSSLGPGGAPDWVGRRISPPERGEIERASPRVTNRRPSPLPALRDLPPNGLALTPPMGWSSYNHFGDRIDDKTVREVADAIVDSGLRDAGYVYVNIDDGWTGSRDASGVLHANSRFPDMKALADYVHAKGLKLGLYSSPGPMTCAGYLGSNGHEEQDASTFAQWGIDYLKYDWCSAGLVYTEQGEMQAVYQKMGAALRASGRPIVYSLDEYGMEDVGKWGRKVGGNVWRTTGDIEDTYRSISDNGFSQDRGDVYAGPGGWNDPDMLEVGNGGMTLEEYRTHMTLWSVLSAPLMLGNDVRNMSAETKELLTNAEVLAIDQDALGRQGHRVLLASTEEVWLKPLSDGSTAVAVFNRTDQRVKSDEIPWRVLGLFHVKSVRDLWRRTNLNVQSTTLGVELPPHGAVLLRVMPNRL